MSPPRMRSNAVGGRLLNSSLAWDGAVMMPLQNQGFPYRFLLDDGRTGSVSVKIIMDSGGPKTNMAPDPEHC